MAARDARPVSFVLERPRTRIAPAAIASAAWHLAFAVFIVLLMRSSPPADAVAVAQPRRESKIVWLPQPGNPRGGGGGGDHSKEPPRQVQRRGADAITIPVVNPPSLNPDQALTDREPLQGVMIPAQSLAGARELLPGLIDAPGAGTASQGDVQIVQSLDPMFGLDLQAIAAVKQWKFAAGTRLGEPVAVRITIELTFTLR